MSNLREGCLKMKRHIYLLIAMLLIGSTVSAADIPKVSLDVKDTPIAQVMEDVSKQTGVKIVCESDVKASITGGFTSIDLEKLLDTIAAMNNLKWQKLYLPLEKDKPLTAEQIKARAAAVAAVPGGTIVVHDASTGKQRVYVEQDPSAPTVDPEKLGLTLVYLISNAKVEPKIETTKETTTNTDSSVLSKLQSLEKERIKLLSQMSSAERMAAIQRETISLLQLDPTVRQQILIDQIMAQRNMDPQTRDLYRQAMRDAFQAMRASGLMPDNPQGNNRGQRRGGRTGNTGG